MTAGVNSPATLNMVGIMRSRPWEAVNVVVRAPFCSAAAALPSTLQVEIDGAEAQCELLECCGPSEVSAEAT